MRPFISSSIVFALSAALVLIPQGKSFGHDTSLSLKNMRILTIPEMMKDVRKADIVFVGEIHTEKEHHDAQLRIIRELKASGAHVVVGLEMFMAERQGDLDRWVRGEMAEKDFRNVYSTQWELPWELYRDILLYSRNQRIPTIGLNVPREITQKVSQEGFASLTREDLKRLPIGISCDVDKSYMDYIETAHKAHGKSGRGFVNFCEAQLMWDKVMAWYIVDYLKRNPGATVVVLAGSVHAWKKGIPAQIKKQSDFTYRVILPWSPDIGHEFINADYADYYLN